MERTIRTIESIKVPCRCIRLRIACTMTAIGAIKDTAIYSNEIMLPNHFAFPKEDASVMGLCDRKVSMLIAATQATRCIMNSTSGEISLSFMMIEYLVLKTITRMPARR